MRYREAAPADAAAIARLHAESWRSAAHAAFLTPEYRDRGIYDERLAIWRERMSAPAANQFVLLAEDGPRLAGFVCAYGDADPQWGTLLDNLHVHREQQGSGLGRELMARAARWCAATHPEGGMYLLVLETNEGARRFYERLGAADAGEGDAWYPPGGGFASSRRYAWTAEQVPEIARLARAPGGVE